MKILNIIIATQDYSKVNHKNLWNDLSNELAGETLIVDLPADLLITNIKKKKYRIREAKLGKRNLNEKLSIIRPLFYIRPEIMPRFTNQFISYTLFKQIAKYYPDLQNYHINILSYSGKWIDILHNSKLNLNFFYYILDEVKFYAHNSKENKKAIKYDQIGCKNSEFIFTMSDKITKARIEYKDKIMTIGNGAKVQVSNNIFRFEKSVAFIGNFRSWIDVNLLTELINSRKDIMFSFVGPIQDDMRGTFEEILNSNTNTSYLGISSKEEVVNYYGMFDAILVPYKQNNFMSATRPIKIVESIFAGTPVITIPMDGYESSSFIRFATDAKSFSNEMDFLIKNPINKQSDEYLKFLKVNSWLYKAKIIAGKFESKSFKI